MSTEPSSIPSVAGARAEKKRNDGKAEGGSKPRAKRSPSALALKQILRMPLGELAALATGLAQNKDTASFFAEKLDAAIKVEERDASS